MSVPPHRVLPSHGGSRLLAPYLPVSAQSQVREWQVLLAAYPRWGGLGRGRTGTAYQLVTRCCLPLPPFSP